MHGAFFSFIETHAFPNCFEICPARGEKWKHGSLFLFIQRQSFSWRCPKFFLFEFDDFLKIKSKQNRGPLPFRRRTSFQCIFHKNMIFSSSHWRVVLFSLNFENWFYDQGVKTLFIFCRKIHFTHFPHRYSKKRKKKNVQKFLVKKVQIGLKCFWKPRKTVKQIWTGIFCLTLGFHSELLFFLRSFHFFHLKHLDQLGFPFV